MAFQILHCDWLALKAGKKVEQVRPRSCSSAATCERGKSGDETRKSTEQEDYHVPRRQLSLRRQR